VIQFIIKIINKYKHFSYRLKSRERKFTLIYKNGGFSGKKYPASGSGSTIQQTNQLRSELVKLLWKYNIKIFLDAPCGDFTWMRLIDLGNINYIGVDIVEEIVNINKANYSEHNRVFLKRDIIKDELPRSNMILCRDCFIHLSNKDIILTLDNFKKSGAKYLLATTFPDVSKNIDLITGRGCRPVNLLLPPFNLPKPIENIVEGCTEEEGRHRDKSLGLWKLIDLNL
jgi:hypothetical protein